ncbi:extracellular solute-binding protein [Paenibacillus filicis]|uniref:Extracellular solute-binding protein n=1 Tax=Paenibacillus filicis TaxID=669464 RepID=A0ABU9DU60_9BACL
MKKKALSSALALTLGASTLLSACGNNADSSGSGAGASSKTQAPTDISILTLFYQKEPMKADHKLIQEVEKRTNTKLKMTWVTPNNFSEKMNVTLASGDIPDLMLIDNIGSPVFQKMVDQGAFWDISPYLKDYPNLMSYPSATWENTKYNGKNYGVPRVRPVIGNTMPVIRQDWLDKLGLKAPTTTDELYQVMKAFKNNAPDGQKDTVGLAGYVGVDNMGQFIWLEQVFTGAAGNYKVADGKLVHTIFDPGMRQSLEWMAKAYQEKLIPQDFAILKAEQARDLVYNSKAGVYGDTPNNAINFAQDLLKVNPNAKPIFTWVPVLSGPYGPFTSRGDGFFGMYVIPKKVSEDKLKRILAFMDYGMSKEGSDLVKWGFPNEDFIESNGMKQLTSSASSDPSFLAFTNIFQAYDKYTRAGEALPDVPGSDKIKAANIKSIDEADKIAQGNPAVGLVSDTYNKVGKNFDKKIQDLKVKIIMGKEPMSAWDDLIGKLKTDAEFNQIIKEMNDGYQKRIGGAK